MVHFCCVPCCSSNSVGEPHLSFYWLPLTNKRLLKQWIHHIGRKNFPINGNTRICSKHFHLASGHMLRCDEVPSVDLLTLSTSITPCKVRKPSMSCEFVDSTRAHLPSETGNTVGTVSIAGDRTGAAEVKDASTQDASTQTEESLEQITGFNSVRSSVICSKLSSVCVEASFTSAASVWLPAILTVPAVLTVSDGKWALVLSTNSQLIGGFLTLHGVMDVDFSSCACIYTQNGVQETVHEVRLGLQLVNLSWHAALTKKRKIFECNAVVWC